MALVFVLIALATTYVPEAAQQRVASGLRASLLRPFVATQQVLMDTRRRATDAETLQARLDSASVILSTQSALVDENRALRDLLSISERLGPRYEPVALIRSGTIGSESMFIVGLGTEDGVRVGAPVVDRHGLVGVIRQVRPDAAVGIDWTHPDFRASAMLLDGTSYGIVENRRGEFREEDRLILTGGAYHERVPDGTPVLTSGLGGVYPRGIPLGVIDGVAEVEAQWRKSYWLRPMAKPAGVTHALVQVGDDPWRDLAGVFSDTLSAPPPFPSDSAGPRPVTDSTARPTPLERLRILADSVSMLRSELARVRASSGGTS